MRAKVVKPFLLVALLVASCSAAAPTHVLAEGAPITDDFAWKKDELTRGEIASSRNDPSFNYFDVGDLSYYSLPLVDQILGSLSNATGVTIERSPKKNSSISIVHDTQVFFRLKNEKHRFKVLGFSDEIIAMLEQRIERDDAKCLTMTLSDNKNDIVTTIILLSENFHSCLVGGLLDSFGVRGSSEISIRTLVSACVLYEGRRRGLRDRESLTRETPRLRDACVAKALEKPNAISNAK